MTRPVARTVFLVSATLLPLFCQTPAFDVASVKIHKPAGREGRDTVHTSPGSLTMRNISLKACVKWAYDVSEYQVSGPDWTASERYDVIAKADGQSTDPEMKTMLRALLTERFEFKFHRETKVLSVYTLSIAKNGPKFHESDSDGETEISPKLTSAAGQRIAMARVTDMLSTVLQSPVVDMTGLKGRYDMNVDASPYLVRDSQTGQVKPPAREDIVNSIFSALTDQLGLKLEQRKMPVDLLIVDHANRVPSEN